MHPVQGRFTGSLSFMQISNAVFLENDVVPVRILSLLQDGTARIAIKGTIIQAKASSDIKEGAFLLMRVRLDGNNILLTPYKTPPHLPTPHPDVFSQLGIPKTTVAAVLIGFFTQNEQQLQQQPLRYILSSLKSFYPHEKKAAFAAALLYARGIEPSIQLIDYCLSALFGLPRQQPITDSETENMDIFRFINHIKKGKQHWVVFPFEKEFNTVWTGSAAFLLDLPNTICLETCVRIHSEENREDWIFTLKDNRCVFSYQGQTALSPHMEEQLTHLLHTCLQEAGAASYTVHYAAEYEHDISLASIDISV